MKVGGGRSSTRDFLVETSAKFLQVKAWVGVGGAVCSCVWLFVACEECVRGHTGALCFYIKVVTFSTELQYGVKYQGTPTVSQSAA